MNPLDSPQDLFTLEELGISNYFDDPTDSLSYPRQNEELDTTDSLSYGTQSQNPTLSREDPLISELLQRSNDYQIHPLQGESGTEEGSSSHGRIECQFSDRDAFLNFGRHQKDKTMRKIIRAWQAICKEKGARVYSESCLYAWCNIYNEQARSKGDPIIGGNGTREVKA